MTSQDEIVLRVLSKAGEFYKKTRRTAFRIRFNVALIGWGQVCVEIEKMIILHKKKSKKSTGQPVFFLCDKRFLIQISRIKKEVFSLYFPAFSSPY